MKLVYSNENAALVSHARNILENEGLEVMLKNEHGSTGMHPQFMFQELWVMNDGDYEKAKSAVAKLDGVKQGLDWTCPKCSEPNDASFEICWKCSSEPA